MEDNNTNILFSSEKQANGGFRVTAKSGHLMTYLVCECESDELATFLANEFNQQNEEARRLIVASVCADPDACSEGGDLLQIA